MAQSGTITALTIQKKNKERVNVFLDESYAFSLSLMAAAQLKKGQVLTPAEVEDLQHEDQYSRAYQMSLRYLGYRARSRKEIETYLRGKEFTEDVVESISARLEEQGYVNDEEFARAWLRERSRFNPKGARALRYELRQKGVTDPVIDQVLTDVDEDEAAWAAVEAKLSSWQRLDRQAFRRKLSGHLSRRGFNYDQIRAVDEKAWESLHPDEAQ